jgi:23S rRNA (adenine2503-C2)-methyltransferase
MIFPACRIESKLLDGGVMKFVSRLADGEHIESVIIPAAGRTTLCISSQAGCRMGCLFCATGRMGFRRDLAAEEIVWQIMAARFLLCRRVDNIVFMGMGEPLDNLDAVARALHVITDQRGLDIAPRHVTVSTAGHADGIRALVAIGFPHLRVAVSINATDDALRSRLMPINRKYPLSKLRETMDTLARGRGETVLIEYVLLAGVNDSEDDAASLARYLKGLPVRVNVIAYNSTQGAIYDTPKPAQIRRFVARLAAEKLFVRIRQSRGQGLLAACGQLGSVAPL